MKILITGGAGFIGSHLCEDLLKKGHKIINIDNFDEFYPYTYKILNVLESTENMDKIPYLNTLKEKNLPKEKIIKEIIQNINNENYKLYYTDIRDKNELENIFKNEKPEIVINLAGLAGVRPSLLKPLEYEEVNIRGYLNLLECSNKFKVKNFIQASSSSVYGNAKKIPFSEDDCVDFPISPYASTKKAGELIGYTYHHLYSINMLQLRFFTVYGERQRPDLAIYKFTNQILNGEKITMYGEGNTYRDYTYFKDIVSGITKGINFLTSHSHEKIFEVINLGNSHTISLKEMIETIERELKIPAEIIKLPLQAGDVDRTFADIDKAKKLIGYEPKTNFNVGIKNFITWFKKERR